MASLVPFLKRAAAQVNPFDNGRTFKQPTPVNNRSVVAQATHNGVTNVAGGAAKFIPQFVENYSNTFANIGNRLGGGPQQTIQQNMGGTRLLNGVLASSGATGTNRQLAGDAAQVALSALPGVGKGAPLLARFATGAGVGAGFGAAGAYGDGGNIRDIIHSAAGGALLGGALPVVHAGVHTAAPVIARAVTHPLPLDQNGHVKIGNPNVPELPENAPKPATTPNLKTDRNGFQYAEDHVPVNKLARNSEYQPRTTESGKATEQSVYQNGYNEGRVSQPILVRKEGDSYTVLGGHSRTLGLQRRAADNLPIPDNIKARVYNNISDAEARQISRGANQGGQYENTLDMAKSIAESRADNQTPAVQKANMVKGANYDDYEYLWKAVSKNPSLQNKIFHGALPADEVLRIMRAGRTKGLSPDAVSGIIAGLDKNGSFSRTNAVNVVNMLSGKINAGIARDSQTGLFGTIDQAVNATDLLKEHAKISGDLIRKRNALKIAAGEVKGPLQKELSKMVKQYNDRLSSISNEIKQRYNDRNAAASATTAQSEATALNKTVAKAKPQPAKDFKAPLTPTELEAKAKAYFSDVPKATKDYQKYTMEEFGTKKPNIVSGDSAKFIVNDDNTLDPTHSGPYHEPASSFAKDYYKKLLADPKTKNEPVLITAGGAGAGKTSSLVKLGSLDKYAAINDTNLTTMKSAIDRIEPALESGRKVQIAYVYREAKDAFTNGNIPRGNRIGRIVPILAHADTHVSSLETIKEIAKKYKDNPNVDIRIIDNSKGAGKAEIVANPVEFLAKKSYNKDKLTKELLNELQTAETNGTVTKQTAHAYREGLGPEPSRKPQQEHDQKVALKKVAAADALKRSDTTSAPSSIKDLIAAKKAKIAGATSPKLPPKSLDAAAAKPSTPPLRDTAKPATGSSVQNRLTKGAKQGRQNVSPEVAAKVDSSHVVRNTQKLQDTAAAKADAQGLDKTLSDAHTALQAKPGQITDKVVADAQQAIERADAAGKTEDAVNLHDKLADHLTSQGQSIQAASLFYKLSPAGQLYKALRDIKKGGGEVTPELEQRLRDLSHKIKDTPKGDAKDVATAEFHKAVSDHIPQSKLEGALSIWKAGMLSGVKTHTGNSLSNGVFGLLKHLSDPVSSVTDIALQAAGKTKLGKAAGLTGARTKVTTLRGAGSGTMEGLRKGARTLKTGIDTRNVTDGGKYEAHGELNFKNPIIQHVFGDPTNLVFRAMNAGDQPFDFAGARRSLYDQAIAAAKTKGLKGTERETFVKNLVANPTKKMAQIAKNDGEKAVLAQPSKLAGSLSKLAHDHPAAQVIVPFIKVPTNFLNRTLDYSPVGAIKALVHATRDIHSGKGIDQRAFSEAVGEATTGTALIAVGAHLANGRYLSGAYPTDPKEQQRWKAEGIQPNAIKIGNKWISLNYMGPVGLLLNAGKEFHDATAQGNNQYAQALASFGKGLAGQSFLSGLNSFANALTDPGRYLTNLKNSEAGSLVPAWANDLANLMDKYQRQASTVPQTIQSRVPGLRNKLPVKTDVYGNNLPQRSNPVDQAADPLRPSNSLTGKNDVVKEVNRLHGVDPNNKDLQVTPVPVTSLKTDQGTVKLTADQKYQLNNLVGAAIQDKWGQLIKTPDYQALSDADKAQALTKLRSDATTMAERQYVTDNNLGTYAGAPTKAVQRLFGGQGVSDYATPARTDGGRANQPTISGSVDQPTKQFLKKYQAMSADQRKAASYSQKDFDYQTLKAQYANDSANGTLSKAAAVKAEYAVNKAQIGATYSRDVRDLYALSKAEVSSFLASTPDGSRYAAQLKAYDQALYDAGVTTSLKYKSGFAPKGRGSGLRASSLPHFKAATIKTPRLRVAKAAMPKLKANSRSRSYASSTRKISTNAISKLKVGAA